MTQPEKKPIAFRIKSPESINNSYLPICHSKNTKTTLFNCSGKDGNYYIFKDHPLTNGWEYITHISSAIQVSPPRVESHTAIYSVEFSLNEIFLEEIIYEGDENV